MNTICNGVNSSFAEGQPFIVKNLRAAQVHTNCGAFLLNVDYAVLPVGNSLGVTAAHVISA